MGARGTGHESVEVEEEIDGGTDPRGGTGRAQSGRGHGRGP